MAYYDPYVQGVSLRMLLESEKKRLSRINRKREKYMSDLDENGK